jgi:hypothetical protein
MMTEEHIKESISLRYVELLAAFNGFKTSSSYPDYGTDLKIEEVDYRIENEKKIYSETGRELKIQFKATTEKGIVDEKETLKYDLDSVTFNTLIDRKDKGRPLILILFILPIDKSEWLNISDNELIARKCAYWYFPNRSEQKTVNTTKKRIEISKNNIITNETLNQLFENFS